MFLDQRADECVESELVRLPTKIWKDKIGVEKRLVLHCSSDLFMLKYHFLKHLVGSSERPEFLSRMDARSFGHSSVLIK